jgi:nanoRNase/pAp phosphatase (c-di-AMP/oligoRNAs hydrolase)
MRSFQFPERVRSFFNLVHRQSTKSIQLWCHKNADIDSLGAAIGLYHLLKTIKKSLQVSIHVDSCSEITKAFIETLGVPTDLSNIYSSPESDMIIIVDFNTPEMISSEWNSYSGLKVIVDHHELDDKEVIADLYISEVNYIATCELITALYEYIGVHIPPFVANYLLAGIIYDSQRFRLADKDLFLSTNFLLEKGGKYSLILRTLEQYPPFSERIAKIKAAQRMKKIQFGEIIVLCSFVRSFEASAARALLSLGGDVALVVSERADETRISVRATSQIVKKTRINVCNHICLPLAKKFGGTGGGHEGAGGVNLKGKIKYAQVLDAILNLFSNINSLTKLNTLNSRE